MPLQEKTERCGRAGLWLETLESAIALRPFENEASWTEDFLAQLSISQDLEDITNKPFIDCCQLDEAQ